jgi:hypothetical protein
MAATAAAALVQLAAELRAEDSVISAHVLEPAAPAALGILAGSGPRTRARSAAYAAIVECVREGYLLHYGRPRLLAPPDPDLALLAGDYLYAKGLERLAAIGDQESVGELSDLITLSAQLHAVEDGGQEVAAPLWLASAVAVAAGASAAHERAKREIGAGGPVEPLLTVARESAAAAALGEQLAQASEAVGFAPSHLG